MKKKIFFLTTGILLIGVVVFLGIKTRTNDLFIVPFGLASALVAPAGMELISAFFNVGNSNLLKKLLKIPQIDELIQKAETQEEKLKLLEEERKQLSNIVRYETLKHAAIERKRHLEQEAQDILNELEKVEKEIEHLNLKKDESRVSNQVIDELYRKLEDEENHENTSLMVMSAVNSLPIHIPFLNIVSLMILNLVRREKKKRRR